jgi:ribosomal protein S18 acetylase RimI-like enzyme
MDDLPVKVRRALSDDASEVARVYIESWHDTYPGVVPTALLTAMTHKGQTARWRSAIRSGNREAVFVAEHERDGILGMMSFGPARDADLGFNAEIYTLYVDPGFFGRGIGRAMMFSAFARMRTRSYTSCIIWAHAKNPARFFYERMGGRLIAERTARMMGDPIPETGFGWQKLALAERSEAR